MKVQFGFARPFLDASDFARVTGDDRSSSACFGVLWWRWETGRLVSHWLTEPGCYPTAMKQGMVLARSQGPSNEIRAVAIQSGARYPNSGVVSGWLFFLGWQGIEALRARSEYTRATSSSGVMSALVLNLFGK